MQQDDFFPDLRVAFFEGDGADLRVDLYGGANPTCGSVVFTFGTVAERERYESTLQRWCDEDVIVHLTHGGSEATLTASSSTLDLR